MDNQKAPLLEDSDEDLSLGHSINDQDKPRNTDIRIKKPKRKIIVEPILIMLSLVTLPLQLTVSLFTYHEFQEDAAKKFGLNISDLNQSQMCDINTSSVEYQVTQEAQVHNSFFNIITGLASAVPCLFTTIFLGPYCDMAGRKYAIIIPLFGGLIYACVCSIVVLFKLSVWYLVIGNFVDGLSGKYTMLLLGCFSYIADICEPKNRQFRITVVECIFFMSAMLGPIGLGYWIENHGYVVPIVIVVAVYLLNILYSLFLVPETVIKDPDAKFWTMEHFKKIIQLFTQDDPNKTKRVIKLRWLYLAFLPVIMVALGDQITTLFLQNLPFCWDSVKIGNYFAIYIAVITIGGMISAKLFKICLQDESIALVSAISSVGRNTYHAFVKTDIMVYLIPAASIFSVLFIPTLRAMMSNLVGPHEQGAVFGAIALSEVIFSFAGNFIFSAIYASTISFMSGFVYLSMALFYLLGFLVLLFYVIWSRKQKKLNQPMEDLSGTGE